MNSFGMQQIDPALVDYIHKLDPGYSLKVAAGDTPDVLWDVCGSASRAFPEKYRIDRKDWADKARENDKYDTWPINYIDRFTNQNPTHECTCHSLSRNMEAARNRHRAIIFKDGPKKNFRYEESKRGSVWLSPLSVYAEANPRKYGGAGVRQVLEIAVRRGMLPEKIQPANWKFEHALQGTTGQGNSNQSQGIWVPLSQFPNGWQKTAAWFKPKEVIFPGSWEEAVCLVLHGFVVSVGRNGHAIPWARWLVDSEMMEYPDSYDVLRYDSLRTVKSAWQGSFAIASTSEPDDWNMPAGQ